PLEDRRLIGRALPGPAHVGRTRTPRRASSSRSLACKTLEKRGKPGDTRHRACPVAGRGRIGAPRNASFRSRIAVHRRRGANQGGISYKEVLKMRTLLAATCFAAGALLVPLGASAADMKDATANKAESAKEYMQDATITAKVKTEFAKDKQVSAMKIKVDTD